MESSISSSSSTFSLSQWDYLELLILRPLLAVVFTISLILIGWWLAWKLVLVHVPLVQEIFGLRKKPLRQKPQTRRLSKLYNIMNNQNSAFGWKKKILEYDEPLNEKYALQKKVICARSSRMSFRQTRKILYCSRTRISQPEKKK